MTVRLFWVTTIFFGLAFLSEVSANDIDNELGANVYKDLPKSVPYITNEEVRIHIIQIY